MNWKLSRKQGPFKPSRNQVALHTMLLELEQIWHSWELEGHEDVRLWLPNKHKMKGRTGRRGDLSWTHEPLCWDQVRYAAADVAHLIMAVRIMHGVVDESWLPLVVEGTAEVLKPWMNPGMAP